MLRLEEITVQYGPRKVLDKIDLVLHDRERVAVVGRNGAGKSTLLKIAAGEAVPDEGETLLGKGQTAAYLEQEPDLPDGLSLWEVVFAEFQSILALEAKAQVKLAEASGLPSGDPRATELFVEAEELSERFRQLDGYQAEAACGRVLSGLGFAAEDRDKPAKSFSGGWRVRMALARLLLRRPTFLLLDEPTNHLDLETRTWLLHELKRYNGTVVLISHDRDFLDRLVTRCVEISAGIVTTYAGGWTKYRAARTLRMEQLRKAAAERAEERSRIEAFIRRFRAKASKAAQVQARVKQLEKLPPIKVPATERQATLRFDPAPPVGEPVLEVRGVSKSFGDNHVLRGTEARVQQGQRIVLVGHNGAGKSTLLKMIAGDLAPDAGSIRRGPGCKVAWFAQDQAEALDPDATVLSAVAAAAPHLPAARVRSLVGSLLFVGDDAHKRIAVLSGGEKSRVALARILVQRANVLLLDEPTNHLDVETQDVLAAALKGWDGTIVFVSHDRAFVDGLAETVWEVGQGGVREFFGGLEDFLWARATELGVAVRRAPGERAPDAWLLGGLPVEEEEARPTQETGRAVVEVEGTGKEAWAERKRIAAEEKRREKRLGTIEDEIAALEEIQAARSTALQDPELATDWDRLATKTAEWEAGQKALDALWTEYGELEA